MALVSRLTSTLQPSGKWNNRPLLLCQQRILLIELPIVQRLQLNVKMGMQGVNVFDEVDGDDTIVVDAQALTQRILGFSRVQHTVRELQSPVYSTLCA